MRELLPLEPPYLEPRDDGSGDGINNGNDGSGDDGSGDPHGDDSQSTPFSSTTPPLLVIEFVVVPQSQVLLTYEITAYGLLLGLFMMAG